VWIGDYALHCGVGMMLVGVVYFLMVGVEG
jgi:hypothetical protein